jgi:hypothetical protein
MMTLSLLGTAQRLQPDVTAIKCRVRSTSSTRLCAFAGLNAARSRAVTTEDRKAEEGGLIGRLFWKIRGSPVHETLPVQRSEEINQRIDVAIGKVKGTNLRIEVGIADATPFVEQDDVSQGR